MDLSTNVRDQSQNGRMARAGSIITAKSCDSGRGRQEECKGGVAFSEILNGTHHPPPNQSTDDKPMLNAPRKQYESALNKLARF